MTNQLSPEIASSLLGKELTDQETRKKETVTAIATATARVIATVKAAVAATVMQKSKRRRKNPSHKAGRRNSLQYQNTTVAQRTQQPPKVSQSQTTQT